MSSASNTTATGSEPTSVRLVLTLSLAGLLSGLIIVTIFEVTLPTITAYKAEQLRLAVFKVLPGVTNMKRLVYSDGKLTQADEELPEEEALDHYRRVRDEIRYFIETLPDSLKNHVLFFTSHINMHC